MRERDKAIVDSLREGREARKYFSFYLLLYIYILLLSQPAPGQRERDKAIVDSWREGREARQFFLSFTSIHIHLSQLPSRGR